MALYTSLYLPTEVVLARAVTSFAYLQSAPATPATTQGAYINVAATNRGTGTNWTYESGVWQRPGFGSAHVDSAIFIYGSAALTFSGGLGLYGWRADANLTTSQWFLLGVLNGGVAPPVIAATSGFSQVVETVGIYAGLGIGPLTTTTVTVTGGTCTVRACQ